MKAFLAYNDSTSTIFGAGTSEIEAHNDAERYFARQGVEDVALCMGELTIADCEVEAMSIENIGADTPFRPVFVASRPSVTTH